MAEPRPRRSWTLPNAVCLLRIAGSGVLVALAAAQASVAFLVLLVILIFTDWIDGKLAILLDQRSELGARIDSVADAVMYAAALTGAWLLRRDALLAELPWIGVAAASWLAFAVTGLAKFRKVPSYHTRAAKTSWLLMAVGLVLFFAGASPWGLRVAMLGVTVTNLEAIAITAVLPREEVDVGSLGRALRLRGERSRAPPDGDRSPPEARGGAPRGWR